MVGMSLRSRYLAYRSHVRGDSRRDHLRRVREPKLPDLYEVRFSTSATILHSQYKLFNPQNAKRSVLVPFDTPFLSPFLSLER